MKTEALNPISIPFAQPPFSPLHQQPRSQLLLYLFSYLFIYPITSMWNNSHRDPFLHLKKNRKYMHFFPPGILHIVAKRRICQTFHFAGDSHEENGKHFSPSLYSHQEQQKSNPGTFMILITLFFIRSCGKSPLVPSHDELPRNLHQENS